MSGSKAPVTVITGASSGIGAATARALAGLGHRVVLGARRRDRLEQLANETGGLSHELDVTRTDSIAGFVEWVESSCGHIDVLVNNAGLALAQDPVEALADEDVVRMW